MNASIANTSYGHKHRVTLSGGTAGGYGNRWHLLDRPRYLRTRPSPHALEIRESRAFWAHTVLSGLACLMFFGGIVCVLWGLS